MLSSYGDGAVRGTQCDLAWLWLSLQPSSAWGELGLFAVCQTVPATAVMSVCLAGPSEGLGYGRTSPCREEKARAALRHGTSSLKSTKALSTEPGPFLGERIDPALPLESQW